MRLFLAALFALSFLSAPLKAWESSPERARYDIKQDCALEDSEQENALYYCKNPTGGNTDFYVEETDYGHRVVSGYISLYWMTRSEEGFATRHELVPEIEWRPANSDPFAAIQRVFVTNAQIAGQVDELLLISRVGPVEGDGQGCILALVDVKANPDADGLARQVADSFSDPYKVNCETHVPDYHGKVSENPSMPVKVIKAD